MLKYLSKPEGTHGVFPGTRSQGGYDIVKLKPGTTYLHGYPKGDFVGERDSFSIACDWADACDGIPNPYA
jgi:hypothetical protein